jgi:hypothetical protein
MFRPFAILSHSVYVLPLLLLYIYIYIYTHTHTGLLGLLSTPSTPVVFSPSPLIYVWCDAHYLFMFLTNRLASCLSRLHIPLVNRHSCFWHDTTSCSVFDGFPHGYCVRNVACSKKYNVTSAILLVVPGTKRAPYDQSGCIVAVWTVHSCEYVALFMYPFDCDVLFIGYVRALFYPVPVVPVWL